MILKLSDFVNIKVNWNDKYQNINNIANEIGIGLNSIVFFDDSKIEREAMKKLLPEVNTLDIQNDVTKYIDYIENSGFFDNITFTKEDLSKTKKYLIRSKGSKLIEKFKIKDDFLKSLKMISIIKPVNEFTLARAAQLTNKTNQFNLNLKRYDAIKLKNLLKDKKKVIALTIQVKDKFGDHGVVGLAVAIQKDKNTWELDNFLLSCRVLGRDVEKSLLYQIINSIKKRSKNVEFLRGSYKKGERNDQVKNFYSEQKFKKHGSKFLYNFKKQDYKNTKFIKIIN
jgi:FkbH-like protein